MTAEEKAQKYKEMQLEFFNSCVKDLSEEEHALKSEPSFGDKEKELEKRQKEELKKLEKVFKKEAAEVEDLN
jgi:hypothetical protein